jgi:hypothetical protein
MKYLAIGRYGVVLAPIAAFMYRDRDRDQRRGACRRHGDHCQNNSESKTIMIIMILGLPPHTVDSEDPNQVLGT